MRLVRALDRLGSIDAFTATILTLATPLMLFTAGIAFHQRQFANSLKGMIGALTYLALAVLFWSVIAYRQGRQETHQEAEGSRMAPAEA